MKNYVSIQCLLILIVLLFVKFECHAQMLNLYEGDICHKGNVKSLDHVCRHYTKCKFLIKGIRNGSRPPLCSFDNDDPIICCPPDSSDDKPETQTYSATEMCHEYSKLIYRRQVDPVLIPSSQKKILEIQDCVNVKPLIVGGQLAEAKEFPHMALLGYEETVDNTWKCGGSVISNRWILSAAHCEKSNNEFVKWARLGELDYNADFEDSLHADYKIEQRVIHPEYKDTLRYNDIALFGLDKDIEFTAYIRPVCLHTEYSIKSATTLATGWGKVEFGWGSSSALKKVKLDIFQTSFCQSVYANNNNELPRGIDDNSMLCVGYLAGGRDTCSGDSGGPIQIPNNYKCMYTQIGITSFGNKCALKDSGSVYTRVSNYIPWIEKIVWPKYQ